LSLGVCRDGLPAKIGFKTLQWVLFNSITSVTALRCNRPVASPWQMDIRYLTPLSANEQQALGLPEPQPMAIADRVRYSELDVLNHVNNKAYMEWFETLRTQHFFSLCAPFYEGVDLPRTVLRNADIHYVKEMVAGESYVATARVSAFRATSYTIKQMIWSDGLRAKMTGVMVMLCPDGSGRLPLPPALTRYFEHSEAAVRQ